MSHTVPLSASIQNVRRQLRVTCRLHVPERAPVSRCAFHVGRRTSSDPPQRFVREVVDLHQNVARNVTSIKQGNATLRAEGSCQFSDDGDAMRAANENCSIESRSVGGRHALDPSRMVGRVGLPMRMPSPFPCTPSQNRAGAQGERSTNRESFTNRQEGLLKWPFHERTGLSQPLFAS